MKIINVYGKKITVNKKETQTASVNNKTSRFKDQKPSLYPIPMHKLKTG